MRNLTKCLSLAVQLILLMGGTAFGGNGRFVEHEDGAGVFNFVVTIRDSSAFNDVEMGMAMLEQRFTDASEIIFNATGGKHRFGTITICFNRATDYADFWIDGFQICKTSDSEVGGYGHISGVTVFGEDETGEAGDASAESVDDLGAQRRTIITWDRIRDDATGHFTIAHEFGHLAYGLYDEYSGPEVSGIGGDQTVCVMDEPFTACLMENYYTKTSELEPEMIEPPACRDAQELANPALASFCHDDNHTDYDDDDDERTYQDDIRDASCWATITEQFDIEPPADEASLPVFVAPNFVIAEDEQRIVMIIDRSGSMAGERIQAVKDASEPFVLGFPEEKLKLGVVSFATNARSDFSLTDSSPDSRDDAVAEIRDLVATGATALGAGLNEALNLLPEERACPETFVLLSDGFHNFDGSFPVDEMIARLIDRGVVVFTVGIGEMENTELLERIANETGGLFFDSESGLSIDPAMMVARSPIAVRGSSLALRLQNIYTQILVRLKESGFLLDQPGKIQGGTLQSLNVPVDNFTQRVDFLLNWGEERFDLDLSLVDSNGEEIVPEAAANRPDVTFSASPGHEAFTVEKPDSGTWQMRFQNREVASSLVSFRAFTLSNTPQHNLFVSVASDTVSAPEPVRIRGELTADGRALVEVDIKALVRKPGVAAPDTVRLFDNGQVGDGASNDGIYTALFSDYTKSGSYTFTLIGKSVNGRNAPVEAINRTAELDTLPQFSRSRSIDVVVQNVRETISQDSLIYAVNKDTQELTSINLHADPPEIAVLGRLTFDASPVEEIEGMAWDPSQRQFYLHSNTDGGWLYKLPLTELPDLPADEIRLSRIGQTGSVDLNDIAVNPRTGELFGIMSHNNPRLVRIDSSSALLTNVGEDNLPFTDVEALTFTIQSSPVLYGYDTEVRKLVSINTLTGKASAVSQESSDIVDVESMAFIHHGFLLGFSDIRGASNKLVSFNPVSGLPADFALNIGDYDFEAMAHTQPGSLAAQPVRRSLARLITREPLLATHPTTASPGRGTTIPLLSLELQRSGDVKVIVLDQSEQEISKVVDGPYDAGRHEIKWDGKLNTEAIARGEYFYYIEAGDYRQVIPFTVGSESKE